MLAFPHRVAEAHEPMRVQTFRPELSIQAFDEGARHCRSDQWRDMTHSVGFPGREKSSVTPRW
jgi:hypothetical protein